MLKLRGSLQQSSVHLQCHAFNSYGHTSKVGCDQYCNVNVNDKDDKDTDVNDEDDDGDKAYRLAKLYTGYVALGYIAKSHITFPVWLYTPKER